MVEARELHEYLQRELVFALANKVCGRAKLEGDPKFLFDCGIVLLHYLRRSPAQPYLTPAQCLLEQVLSGIKAFSGILHEEREIIRLLFIELIPMILKDVSEEYLAIAASRPELVFGPEKNFFDSLPH